MSNKLIYTRSALKSNAIFALNGIIRKKHFPTCCLIGVAGNRRVAETSLKSIRTKGYVAYGLLRPPLRHSIVGTSFWKVGQERLVARAGTRSTAGDFCTRSRATGIPE